MSRQLLIFSLLKKTFLAHYYVHLWHLATYESIAYRKTQYYWEDQTIRYHLSLHNCDAVEIRTIYTQVHHQILSNLLQVEQSWESTGFLGDVDSPLCRFEDMVLSVNSSDGDYSEARVYSLTEANFSRSPVRSLIRQENKQGLRTTDMKTNNVLPWIVPLTKWVPRYNSVSKLVEIVGKKIEICRHVHACASIQRI